jgi:hypothetical protein
MNNTHTSSKELQGVVNETPGQVQTITNETQAISHVVQTNSGEVRTVTNETQSASRSVQTGSGEVAQLLKANTTLAVWLVFLALGGGLLALYYARIGYLPDIEWSASIIYLAAASFIGGGLGLLLALSLFLPGFIWGDMLLLEPGLVEVFCYDGIAQEPCLRSTVRFLGIPFAVVLLFSHIALLAGVLRYSLVALVLLGGVFFWMQRVFKKLLVTASIVPPLCEDLLQRMVFKYACWFTLSVLLSQISMLIIYRLSGRPAGEKFVILTLICTLGVLISNHVVAARYRRHPRQAIVASLLAASLLLFAADRFSPLSLRVMGYFGIGGDRIFSLVVNQEGTDIIRTLALPNKCAEATPDRLCGVKILSKLGSEYYLSQDGRTFTLPKKDVLSTDSADQPRK